MKLLLSLLMSLLSISFSDNALATPSAFNLNFQVANPENFNRVTPSQLNCPTPGGGTASNPIVGADFASSLNSYSSSALGLGQIVPFQVKIKVDGDTTAENGTITSSMQWNTKTSSNKNFGYDATHGVYCAFIDTGDSSNVGLDGNENVSFASSITGGGDIQGDFTLSGLNDGDTVVLEIWVVLQNQFPSDANGVVLASLGDTQTSLQEPINTGNQTVPLTNVQEFRTSTADIVVQKVDAPDPVDALGTLSYILSISNLSPNTVSNLVVLTDTLDPNTQFVSTAVADSFGSLTTCSHSGEPAGGTVTCIAGFLNPLEAVKIRIVVNVLPSAGFGTGGTGPCSGTESLCNNVSVASLNDDNQTNNSTSQPTAVIGEGPHSALIVDKVPDVTAIRNSGQVIYSYAVAGLFATSEDQIQDVSATDDKCSPVTFVNGDTNNNNFIDPGETWNYQCTTTLTQTTTNIVTVTASDAQTAIPLESTDSATVTVINPAMSLLKTVDQNLVEPGTLVIYSFDVTNTGDDNIAGLSIDDPNCTPIVFDSFLSGDDDSLFEPSEMWRYTCSKTITETTVNTAIARGFDSLQGEVSSEPSSVTVTVITPTATPTPCEGEGCPTATPTPTPTQCFGEGEECPTPTPTVTPTKTPTATPTVEPTQTTTIQDFGCSETSIRNLLFRLDGTSNRQLTLINRLGGKIRSLKSASASTKRTVLKEMNTSKILQEQNWVFTWSIPEIVSQCVNANALLCVTTSNASKLEQYSINANKLKATGLKLAGILKRFGKVNAKLAKQYQKSVPAEYEKALSFVSQVPVTSTRCG